MPGLREIQKDRSALDRRAARAIAEVARFAFERPSSAAQGNSEAKRAHSAMRFSTCRTPVRGASPSRWAGRLWHHRGPVEGEPPGRRERRQMTVRTARVFPLRTTLGRRARPFERRAPRGMQEMSFVEELCRPPEPARLPTDSPRTPRSSALPPRARRTLRTAVEAPRRRRRDAAAGRRRPRG